MPTNKPDKWAQYEATPASAVKPDKWAQYAAAPAESTPAGPSDAELTTNTIDPTTGAGYGLYDVPGLGKVPFNRIPDALAAGHVLPPATAARYRDDLAATKPSWFQRTTEPTPMNSNTTPVDSSWSANKDAAWNAAANAMGVGGNTVKRAARAVVSGVEFPFHAAGTFADSMSSDPDTSARAEDAILAMHPGAQIADRGKEFSQDWKTSPALAVENVAGDALGMYLTGKLAEGAMKAPGAVSDAAQSAVRRMAGTGPAVARDLVRSVTEDNRKIDLHNTDRVADAQQAWQEKQAKALDDHRSELLRLKQKYAQDARDATEKARTGTAEDRAAHQSKQLAAKQAYDQSVRDQTAKFEAERTKAQQANVEAQRAHNQEIGETARNNKAATEAERAKTAQNAKLQVGGSQLIYGLRQLDKSLRDRAATMYDAIREKVGGQTLPGTDLGQAARTAMSKISGTSVTPTVFRDILGKYPEAEPEFIEYQGAQIPKTNRLYDVLKQQGMNTGVPPVTFKDLQGYHSELGAELAKGTLPGDVYQATRDLQESITDMMQDMAKKAGANNDLINARKFYREYMDAFHEPTGPSASGSPVAQALLAKDPLVAAEKFASKSGDRGIAFLRRYSDSLANLAQDVQRTAQTEIKVPARKTMVGTSPKTVPVPAGANLPLPPILEPSPALRAQNLPLPPVLPEPEQVPYRAPKLTPTKTISAEDLQRANEAGFHSQAQGVASRLTRWAAIWPAFRMLSELSRTGETSLRPMAALPAAGVAGMGVETLLDHPGVREFFTKPTRQQIARIPPELRGQMPEIVAMAKQHGVPISPLVAAYAASIQRQQQQHQQQVFSPAQAIQAMQPAGATQ
jgi:hypothetical protein